MHWRLNVFEVLRGKIGSTFVREVTRLIEAYNDATALESVAMKAVMVLPALLFTEAPPQVERQGSQQTAGEQTAEVV